MQCFSVSWHFSLKPHIMWGFELKCHVSGMRPARIGGGHTEMIWVTQVKGRFVYIHAFLFLAKWPARLHHGIPSGNLSS
jgi:hypothetical protein